MIIPTHLQIETINGVCTSKCIMCSVYSLKRKYNKLSIENYKIILDKFNSYKENIKYLSLTGQGEPLLDKDIVEKIKIAKDMGFNGIGFPTNCTELNKEMSVSLIKAGLNTIICSIDGITKETHESIRIGTTFENITHNVRTFIEIRNFLYENIDNKFNTKILIRFIYQNINKHEWNDFYNYWKPLLNESLGDDVIKFNVHNCGGKIDNFKLVDTVDSINSFDNNIINKSSYICKDIFERIIILSDGNVLFCCNDPDINNLGNVLYDNPIKIFNNEIYTKYRKLMKEGKIQELEHCKDCKLFKSRNQLVSKVK